MKTEIINKIIEWFENNEEVFNECIEELDSWNGYLGDDRYYPMDELNEHLNGQDPIYILERAFYGHDDDSWITDEHGRKEHREFNPNREYFYYNGYGNLVSTNYKDYSDKLDHFFVETLAKASYDITTISEHEELAVLMYELEE